MLLSALALFAAFQQAPVQAPAARLVVTPAAVSLVVGDTARLRAAVLDSAGRELRGAPVRWFQNGGHFEATVDSTGLVTAGAVGSFDVTAFSRPAGSARALTAVVRVTMLPPPAARLVLEPAPGTAPLRLYAGQSLAVRATPLAATGDRRADPVRWTSSAPAVASVGAGGRLVAGRPGAATLTATAGRATSTLAVRVLPNPVASVALESPAREVRTGDVVRLRFAARTAAGRPVADARPEWALAPGDGQIDDDGAFVADLPGTYRVVATFAGRSAETTVTVRPRDAVRPTTLVGRLPMPGMTSEFWLHPDGRHGYLASGGDRIYALDLKDPAKPLVTDSVVVDARSVNDVMSTEDGRFGVMTREGASNRRNGIVVLSFEDPAHPKAIAEYTETVTGGVHSTFVYEGHVYLTDDATGSMRVIDIRDPYRPKEVARWETPRTPAGRMLHDIDVKDGLAYLSYWNDGLVVLDVGNGVKGGSPSDPRLVTQYKYDLDALYRDVEAAGGPGFIRGTHTAWRHRDYVFIADEVFPAGGVKGAKDAAAGRAYGRLQVVDVSDMAKPKTVAWYEPEFGGVHNIWVAGDTLYMGAYNGGFRAFDVSGELRGDLRAQGREIAHLNTADMDGRTQNAAMTWGVVVKDGLAYVNDMNNGLWVVRILPKREELTP
jgi:hypothetical protein